MLKKLLPKTPFGIAMTAAAVLVTVSPEARRMTRTMAVKGIGAILGVAEGIKDLTAGAVGNMAGLIAEAKSHGEHSDTAALTFDMDLEPQPVFDTDQEQMQDSKYPH